jgi:hypothetical protein
LADDNEKEQDDLLGDAVDKSDGSGSVTGGKGSVKPRVDS